MRAVLLIAFILCPWVVLAQDPAEGWMGYATGQTSGRITYMEAKWVVPDNPKEGGAFYSPWFGIEASDNLNLIQPVNPWSGYGWQIYNEYFQWEPTHNFNSEAHDVQAGDVVFGSVTFNANNQSYTVYHSDMNDGWSVSSNIPVQKASDGNYKQYNIAYFVMEKSQWSCSQYPPNGEVLFYDIKVEADGKPVHLDWSTAFVDDHCNCRAHIVNSTAISITWDVNAVDDAPSSSFTPLSATAANATDIGPLHSGVSAFNKNTRPHLRAGQ